MLTGRNCFKKLRRFFNSPDQVVVMLQCLKSVYKDYLTCPVQIKSISSEGTVAGIIDEVGTLFCLDLHTLFE